MSDDVKQAEAVDEEFKTECDECSELVLYMTINTMGAFIWRMEHDMADGRIPKEDHAAIDKDVARMRERSKYAASKTTRFGVENPTDSEGGPSEEYWLWFRWWDSYVKALPEDLWILLESAINEEADVSGWRPEGFWYPSGKRIEKYDHVWEWQQPNPRIKGHWRTTEGNLVMVFPPNDGIIKSWFVVLGGREEQEISGDDAEKRAFSIAAAFAEQ